MSNIEESKKGTIGLIIAALVLLVAIVAFSWNNGSNEPKKETCNVEVQPGKAEDVDKLGPNEIQITAENFDAEVLKAKGVVLIDAYAPWCPHCQKITPTISKIADDYVSKVKVGRMNANNQDPATKANFDYAIQNGLQGYPTIWIYKDGKLVETFSGEKTYCELKEALDKQL